MRLKRILIVFAVTVTLLCNAGCGADVAGNSTTKTPGAVTDQNTTTEKAEAGENVSITTTTGAMTSKTSNTTIAGNTTAMSTAQTAEGAMSHESATKTTERVTSAKTSQSRTTHHSTTKQEVGTLSTTTTATVKEADITESPLANARKLLESEKRLTVGFIGGSITYGASAERGYIQDGSFSQFGGDLACSWVNRTVAWLKSAYPTAEIETVNAGVSDTATNFGIFRLNSTLMNTVGHDMPDVVFVEFNTNDWTYSTQSEAHLALQAESLFRNIYAANPYAEIVVVCTQRSENSPSKEAYKRVAEYYGLPFVDVGTPLKQAIHARCSSKSETEGTYYYTVDNLHPSSFGYEVYFEAICPTLQAQIQSIALKSTDLYNYQKALPKPLHTKLLDAPQILGKDDLKISGNAEWSSEPITVGMYDTGLTVVRKPIVDSYALMNNTASVKFTFKGTALGVLLQMGASDVELMYTIDGKAQMFEVNDAHFGFQRYDHAQVFMLAHDLEDTTHEVRFVFRGAHDLKFGGVLVS